MEFERHKQKHSFSGPSWSWPQNDTKASTEDRFLISEFGKVRLAMKVPSCHSRRQMVVVGGASIMWEIRKARNTHKGHRAASSFCANKRTHRLESVAFQFAKPAASAWWLVGCLGIGTRSKREKILISAFVHGERKVNCYLPSEESILRWNSIA